MIPEHTTLNTKTYFEDIGAWPRSAKNPVVGYVTGFILCLALTIAAYSVVVYHVLPASLVIATIVILAALQFLVQITCFLHLGRGAASRERAILLSFVTVIVVILVVGSLWIMSSLNGRMMPTTSQMELYMQGQAGI